MKAVIRAPSSSLRRVAASAVAPCRMAAAAACALLPPSASSAPSSVVGAAAITQSRSFHVSSLAGAAVPPHTKMAMPALSPTMTSGTIIAWRKKPGDALNPGDSIAEVGTDKATVDFEVQDSGYLAKILVPDGAADVKVGSVIAIMVDSAEAVAAFADIPAEALTAEGGAAAAAPPPPAAQQARPAPAAAAPAAPAPVAAAPATPAAHTGGKVIASPLAKKLAADAGVSTAALASLQGTGPNGRIIAADVKEALQEGRLGAGAAVAAAPAPAVSAAAVSAQAAAAGVAPGAAGSPVPSRAGYVDVPHTQMRRVIAQRLTMSKQTVPHYTLTSEVSLDALLALRTTLNGEIASNSKGGDALKLSVNDFIIKASALACRKVPEMNSSWLDDAGIRSYDYVDVAVAVALPDGGGLITPIVADADTKGLLTIAGNVRSLVDKARNKALLPHEYQGGTFTVSNLGMFGVKTFSAIINPPQAGILAIGAAEKRVLPGAAAGEFKQSVVMNATLSCDHRVVDGAVGAQWLAAFKGYLEQPHTMLL